MAGRGHLQLVADYFWLKVIQATGSARKAEEYRDVYGYADLTTDLYSKFAFVYPFAAGVLPTNLGETWVRPQESPASCARACRSVPNSLEMNVLLAYNLSSFHQQYKEAAQALEHASTPPGRLSTCPPWPPSTPSWGEVEAGLALAQSLADSAQQSSTRETFLQRIRELEREVKLRRVDAAIGEYRQQFGVAPPDIQTLSAGASGWSLRMTRRAAASTSVTTSVPTQRRRNRRLEIFTPNSRGYQWKR